ncbi:hypothetical protein [Streptomyces viridochromogenes]|uniref:hypothetical protein n=1 Tax=Streptomyces viridochromogenes TaxID=1938 RepID=UPI00069E9264|nr:hypothetical protein [Streptomyces viridochromogenes]
MTQYRRWPTRSELVTAAIAACWPSVSPVPDTGSLCGDLKTYFSMLAEQVNGREGGVLAGLFVATGNDSEPTARQWPLLAPDHIIRARDAAR